MSLLYTRFRILLQRACIIPCPTIQPNPAQLRIALFLCVLLAPAGIAQPFSFELDPQPLVPVRSGAAVWGDADSDGDLDLLLSGVTDVGTVTQLYRNDAGSLTPADSPFEALAFTRATWADLDADGDLDLALAGSRSQRIPYDPVLLVYRNDGGAFSLVFETAGLHSGSLTAVDVDGDAQVDLVLTGSTSPRPPYEPATRILRRDGDGYTETGIALPSIVFGEIRFADMDADGDADAVLAGLTDSGFTTQVLRNDGQGTFEPVSVPAPGVAYASVDWADYDGDGDVDALVAGSVQSPFALESRLFVLENRGGTFVQVGIDGGAVVGGSARWGDYNSDGRPDILSVGAEQPFGRRSAQAVLNRDDGFVPTSFLVGVSLSDVAWGDYDGDGDPDAAVVGLTSALTPSNAPEEQLGVAASTLYKNVRLGTDFVPPAPAGLQATVQRTGQAGAALSWQPDPRAGVTYEVTVWPAIDPAPAYAAPLPLASRITTSSLRLPNLPVGSYRWQVRSIGADFIGSPVVEGPAFTVGVSTSTETALPAAFALHAPYPNPSAGPVTIQYGVDVPTHLTLTVYDALGRAISTVREAWTPAGTHEAIWRGEVPAGVYWIVLESMGRQVSKTIVVR
ncbi:MAG: T9SS type A sorting domain-containing protein [Bacteroidota bacterium]